MSSSGAMALPVCLVACGGTVAAQSKEGGPPNDDGGDGGVALRRANRVDLLLAIDNSRSMADKQALLAETIPDLVARFLSPRCLVTASPDQTQPRLADGSCPTGTTSEIIPVTDMHIGIVTSSLGGGGAEQPGGSPICAPSASEMVFNKYNAHNDDKAHLVNRKRPTMANATGIEDPVADAVAIDGSGGNFLAWLPNVPSNASKSKPNVAGLTDSPTVVAEFQALVTGAGESGCGLEAQLESWYRFLIQPDPYEAIAINPDPNGGPPKATLVGIDATLLKQRHDFLRPDSAVVIVQLTEEKDSWTDPLAIGGRGWVTRSSAFPGSPTNLLPRGTSECNQPLDPNNPTVTGPNDPNCTSCGFAGNKANGQPIASDPGCNVSCGPNCAGYYTGKDDNLNVRYTNDIKRRYGFDFQFPISRYVDGLASAKVPDRDGEHKDNSGNYSGKHSCANPLFAASVPTDPNGDLCNVALEPRTPDLIYYAHIGGVPWQLLADAKGGDKASLDANDWKKIIGADPGHYDSTGIDSHMIESVLPRTAQNQATIPYFTSALPPAASADNADPITGREWNTTKSPLGLDLEYACIFDLPIPKDCTDPAIRSSRDCVGPGRTRTRTVRRSARTASASARSRSAVKPTQPTARCGWPRRSTIAASSARSALARWTRAARPTSIAPPSMYCSGVYVVCSRSDRHLQAHPRGSPGQNLPQ